MSTLGTKRIVTGTAIVLLLTLASAPRTAMANPNIAKETGQSCAKCHTAPPALNSYGKKYKESKTK